MPVFENMRQNKGLTALKITSNKILMARAHQGFRIIHDTPLITKKNPRPSKGRVPGYTMYQDMLGSNVPDITTLTTILHKRFRPHCVPTAIAWYFRGQENTLDRQYVIKTHHMICEKCLRMSLLKTNATYLHEQFLATTLSSRTCDGVSDRIQVRENLLLESSHWRIAMGMSRCECSSA